MDLPNTVPMDLPNTVPMPLPRLLPMPSFQPTRPKPMPSSQPTRPKPANFFYKGLNVYTKARKRLRYPFYCPHCSMPVTYRAYESHCRDHHSMKPEQECVWCNGATTWKPGDKNQSVGHLMDCLRKFASKRSFSDPFPCLPFDVTPMCEEFHFFNHVRILDTFYDAPIQTYYPPWKGLRYSDRNLNLVRNCTRLYLDTEGVEWFHVMVKIPLYNRFRKAMQEGKSHTLPFSCWCNGGSPVDALYRQHRHLIVFSFQKGDFDQHVLHRLPSVSEVRPSEAWIQTEPILSYHQLIWTIGYVSQRQSKCQFSFNWDPEKPTMDLHFYILQSLPKDYSLIAYLEVDALEFIQKRYWNTDPQRFLHAPSLRCEPDSLWQIQVKDLPDLPLNITLPLARGFQPCSTPTIYCLQLTKTKKIFFQYLPGAKIYGYHTVEPSKSFFNVLAEEWITLSNYQQNYLNEFKRRMQPQLNEGILETVISKLWLQINPEANASLKPNDPSQNQEVLNDTL